MDDLRAGQKCQAFKSTDSAFCFLHGGNAQVLAEAKTRKAKRIKELQEDLELNYHDLQTKEGIASFMEKICNGVMAGFIKRDKAGLLAMFIPPMVKIAMAKSNAEAGSQGGRQTLAVQINIGDPKSNTIAAALTPEQLDRFIMGSETGSIQMIEELQKEGKIKVEKRDDAIEIKAKNPERPEKIKVPKKELQEITGLNKDVIADIFGDTLGDTENAGFEEIIDATEFEHVYNGDVPLELEERPHWFNSSLVDQGNGTAKTVYTCRFCGMETKTNKIKGACPKRHDHDYSEQSVTEYRDETILGTSDSSIFD